VTHKASSIMHHGDSIRWQALVSAAWGEQLLPLPTAKELGIRKALDDPPPCTLYTCTHDCREGPDHFKAHLKARHSAREQQHAIALV
jgi:hypothetical protein